MENQEQQPDTRQIIAETAAELSQLFPTRDEVKSIAENVVPAELLDLDRSAGSGGDVLCQGKAAVNSSVPTAFWGKAVMSIKAAGKYLAGKLEFKTSGAGLEITSVSTPGSESVTFRNTGVTKLNGFTGEVTLVRGAGIEGSAVNNDITIINDGVTKLTAGDAGIVVNKNKGDVTITSNPAKTMPNGYLVTNLYFVDVGDGQKELVGDAVGTGAFAGTSPSGYVIPGGPVGGSGGGGGGTGHSGQVTTYGQAYPSGSNLVQDKFTWTFNNGLLASIVGAGTETIAPLKDCNT